MHPFTKKVGIIVGAAGGGLLALLLLVGLFAPEVETTDPVAQEATTSEAVESAEPEPTDSGSESEPTTEPEPETQEQKPSPEPKPKPKPEPKVVKVQAGQMIEEFEGNEAAADAKYKGKTVQVTGHVAKVDTEFWNEDEYIIQLDGGDDFAILSVNCNDVSAEQAAQVQPGSTITVRGEFDDGGDLGVEVADCQVL